jgi:putative Mg2+ transporter-C (MgtC) family protein
VFHTDIHLLGRVALACVVAFAFGFERQLLGSPAGNRTSALIGATAAAVTAVAGTTSPQAVAGILTGIGFAGDGIVFGYGHLYLGLFVAAIFLFMLELQHIPGLRSLDASIFAARFANDYETPLGPETALRPDAPLRPEAVGDAETPAAAGDSSGPAGPPAVN